MGGKKTEIGTIKNEMEVVGFAEYRDFESDERKVYIVKCKCGHIFNIVNRYFLRSNKNLCKKCKGKLKWKV